MLREIMIITAILAAILSVGASIARSRGAAGRVVAILHYGGYGLMFLSIALFILLGVTR